MSLLQAWASLQRDYWKNKVLNQREIFYQAVAENFRAPNNAFDLKFGQDELLKNAWVEFKMLENHAGILYIEIGSEYSGFKGQHAYSLWLTGDLFRIGLLLYGGLEKAPLVDWQNEIQTIWPGCPPDQQDRDGLTMYEWTFWLPDIATNYATQERYILGLSSMHSRILRIIRDYRLVQRQESERDLLS